MKEASWKNYSFDPEMHEAELRAIVEELQALPSVGGKDLHRILIRHPKGGTSLFSKSEIIAGYRYLAERYGWPEDGGVFVERMRMKPVRTLSGVTPVTILTKPFPCPGKCIFCPNDLKMPKSYLSREPGAQRAAMNQFDPYDQTLSRLLTLHNIGHPVEKVELIVLGGTWSFYPEAYQIWFLKRAFDAMNDFGKGLRELPEPAERIDFDRLAESVDGRFDSNPYNRIITEFLQAEGQRLGLPAEAEVAGWEELAATQKENEMTAARCVGLSLETRPDHVSGQEVERLRRLGATKIQIGYQSLDDEVLVLNERGHDVAASRRATRLLRQAGFKIQAHWMANLYGSTPERDVEDYQRIFADPDFRPDELKLYPCSLIESAELMNHYESGRWRPYEHEELRDVVVACLATTPRYCRLTRVIRDIPGDDILVGNKVTSFRQVAEEALRLRGGDCRDIRAREIRGEAVTSNELRLDQLSYDTSAGEETFLQFVTSDDRIAGFLRLCLPDESAYLEELGDEALIREVHVYGSAVGIGRTGEGKAQHAGLGKRLIERAAGLARRRGYPALAVISSVGTREYYRRQGFTDGELYQHRPCTARVSRSVNNASE